MIVSATREVSSSSTGPILAVVLVVAVVVVVLLVRARTQGRHPLNELWLKMALPKTSPPGGPLVGEVLRAFENGIHSPGARCDDDAVELATETIKLIGDELARYVGDRKIGWVAFPLALVDKTVKPGAILFIDNQQVVLAWSEAISRDGEKHSVSFSVGEISNIEKFEKQHARVPCASVSFDAADRHYEVDLPSAYGGLANLLELALCGAMTFTFSR